MRFEEKYGPSPELRFINPYNFIPVGKRIPRDTNAETLEEVTVLHTGYFECELKAATPLAIPDATQKRQDSKEKDHYIYPAYRLNGKPVIPGSSLRGVFRSVYETLTNSCMVTLDPEEHITRRSDLGTFEAGVLKRDDAGIWRLYKANRIALVAEGEGKCRYSPINDTPNVRYYRQKIKIERDERYLETSDGKKLYWGDEVDIEINGPGHKKTVHGKTVEVWGGRSVSKITEGTGTGCCYLYLGEQINRKHAESVFQIVDNENPEEDNQERILAALDELDNVLAIYRSEAINRNLHTKHFGYRGYERLFKKGVIPLWYLKKNGHLYLSPAAIGRIAFHTPMSALTNGHEPCKDRKKLCPACAVFGMVGKNEKKDDNNKGMGSKVRITDAELTRESTEEPKEYTLKELGAPRTSYLPFYSKGGKDYDDKDAAIQGRKYYWHILEAARKPAVYATDNKTKRNSTIELLGTGSVFTFKVYYDGLSEDQVQMLAWTLTLGGNQTKYLHKIGHGKPLGLGSVKVAIRSQVERSFEVNAGYRMRDVDNRQFDELQSPQIMDEDAWEDLQIISAFPPEPNEKIPIQYPEVVESEKLKPLGNVYKENVLAAHQWFTGYRKSKNKESLPSIKDAMSNPLSIYELIAFEDKDLEKNSSDKGKMRKH